MIEGVAQATAAGMNPQIGQHPDQLSPHLDKTLADKLLADAKGAIYGTFGILPGLMNPATTGPMVREAQRHLAQLVLQPIANLLAEEASEKIGLAVKIDCVRPMQLSTLAARRGLSRRCWARWPTGLPRLRWRRSLPLEIWTTIQACQGSRPKASGCNPRRCGAHREGLLLTAGYPPRRLPALTSHLRRRL